MRAARVLLGLFLLPATAAAATDDEAAELELLFEKREVVVTATRAEATVRTAPSIVSVISAEQIRRSGSRTLVDVLRIVPGLETSIDSLGLPRLAVRGKRSSPQLLLLLDGVRLNDVYDASALLELPSGMIERVEVIRGPGSALYGSNAFAGVVNVITRRRNGQEASAWGGSYATAGGEVLAGAGGAFHLYASGERSDGPELPIVEDALSRNGQGIAGTPEGVTAAGAGSVTAGAAFDRAGFRLQAHALLRRTEPYVGPFDTLAPDGSIRRDWLAASFGWDKAWSKTVSTEIEVYGVQTGVRRDLERYPDGFTTGDRDADGSAEVFVEGQRRLERFTGRTAGVEALVHWKSASDSVTAGAQLELLTLPTYALLTNDENGAYRGPSLANYNDVPFGQRGSERLVAGVFVQDERRLSKEVGLTLGLRHDQYSDFGGSTNPRAAFVWTPGEIWTAKLLFATAFRAPTFRELYDRTEENVPGAFIGNEKLEPEEIRTVEAGAEARLRIRELPLNLRANAFYDDVRGLIEKVQTVGTANRLRNAGEVRSVGGEVEARLALDERTWAFANGSWFRSADLRSDTFLTDVPQWRSNAGIFVSPIDALTIYAVWQAAGERRNNARSTLERLHAYRLPRYDVVHVTVSTEPLWKHWMVSASVFNVLDRKLVDEAPRPDRMPGNIPAGERTFFLQASFVR